MMLVVSPPNPDYLFCAPIFKKIGSIFNYCQLHALYMRVIYITTHSIKFNHFLVKNKVKVLLSSFYCQFDYFLLISALAHVIVQRRYFVFFIVYFGEQG